MSRVAFQRSAKLTQASLNDLSHRVSETLEKDLTAVREGLVEDSFSRIYALTPRLVCRQAVYE